MEEIEMKEQFKILSHFDGEEFERKLDDFLKDFPEDIQQDFLILAIQLNIDEDRKNLNQSKILRDKKEALDKRVRIN